MIGVHIPDGRSRQIVLSLNRAGTPPAVLSVQESEHLHACPACVERLCDIARQIFKEQLASASAEDGRADTEHATDRYPKHRDETTEGQ